MVGFNLHEAVADALGIINPWMTATFTKTTTSWSTSSRTPTKTTSTVSVKCKMQPADLQLISALGVEVQSHQYYRMFISADITQLDKIRNLGSDTFTIDGYEYCIVAKSDWIQNGWREGYCYLRGVATNE